MQRAYTRQRSVRTALPVGNKGQEGEWPRIKRMQHLSPLRMLAQHLSNAGELSDLDRS